MSGSRRPLQDRLVQSGALMSELGSLVLVWAGEIAGLDAYALPLVLGFIAVTGGHRLLRGQSFPRPWILFNAGAILSLTAQPRMNAEQFGAVCNLVAAGLFLIGSTWRVPLYRNSG